MLDFEQARRNMVESQIRPNGVTERQVITAMLNIPRERFVPSSLRPLAYIDEDLRIKDADGESAARYLMEPMPFAKLLDLAEIGPDDVVLDVGCATGYSTAVIAQLAGSVLGLESDQDLAKGAEDALADLGIDNAAIVTGSLAEGCARQAPYDVIVLEGAVEEIPPELFSQLREGGRLVAPVHTGLVGKGTLFRNVDGQVSSWSTFDVAVRPLPGFQRPAAFVF